jgi:photosystem II stability/assembly factor-like uncharacterized protein
MRRNRLALAALLTASCAAMFTGCSCGTSTVAPPLPPLSAVQVTPTLDTLVVGSQRQFTAVALDTNDAVVSGAGFGWSTSNAGVATVNSNGLVTAVGEGVVQVIASAGGFSDSATVAVYFQPGWYAQPSGTTNSLWGVFALPDGREGWAVGDAGTIVHTTDAGVSWGTQVSTTSFSLRSVWFTSAQVGYAAGYGGTVMKTQNGGTSWTRLLTGATANFNDVCFADAAHGWAVGANGIIARTDDAGVTWTKTFPTSNELQGVSFSDTSNGWAVGQGGVIVGTRDGGRSWYVVQPAVTASALYTVWRRSDTEAWAGGAAGVNPVTVATPDSLQWTLGSFGALNTIHGLVIGTSLIGYAVGTNGPGLILKTVDGAVTWQPQVSNSAQALNDVWFVDPLRGWAVGTGGRIVHTSRGGQ